MKASHVFALALVLLFLLVACSLPVEISRTVTANAPVETPSLLAESTDTPIPTGTPTVEFTGQCGWMWANQELPDVSLQLKDAFRKAGLKEVEARASAYGENCFDAATSKVVYFATMQTDFYLTIAVTEISDTQALGGWVETVLPVIDQFPPGKVPGSNPGYIGIRFMGSSGEQNLWFQRQKAQSLIRDGLKGSALYDALGNP